MSHSFQYNKDVWEPGEEAYFEYCRLESVESADAHLWVRSRQVVEVVGLTTDPKNRRSSLSINDRVLMGRPHIYKVRFQDGLEAEVFEGELLTEPKWTRPAPPEKVEMAMPT